MVSRPAVIPSIFPAPATAIGGLRSRVLDPDAAAFIAATGATDTANIDAWVRGLKSLGIWNNVVCWPMRSTQNHGSGTVLRSLGGLGLFNGTLTNGPTWGANGISFDGVNDHIALPTFAEITNASLFYAASFTTLATAQKILRINSHELGKAESTSNGIESTWLNAPSPNVGRGTPIAGLAINTFHTGSSVIISPNSLSRFYNGGSKLTNNTATFNTPQQILSSIGGRTSGNSLFSGTAAVATYCTQSLSDSQILSLHNLYRDTLGAGLGLP